MLFLSKESLYMNINFMLLWFGHLVSMFGSRFHSFAVMLYVLKETGSPSKMGITLAFSVLPAVLVGPLTGYAADRWDRKKIIIISDTVNSILVGALSWTLFMGRFELWILYLITILMSVASAFFSPAVSASIPTIVNKDDLVKANSLSSFSSNLSSVLGPALAGVLMVIIEAPGLFLLDSLSYLASGISEMFIDIPKVKILAKDEENVLNDIKEGILFSFKNKDLLHFTIVGGFIINLFLAPLSLYVPVLASDNLSLGSKELGFLWAALGIGSLVMSIAIPIINRKVNYYTILFLGLTFEGIFVSMLGLSNSFYIAAAAMSLLGACISGCNVSLSTVFQTIIPNEIMGRVASIISIICSITVPFGLYLGGLALESFSTTSTIVVSGVFVAIAGFSTITIVIENRSSQTLNSVKKAGSL